jgi:hypothetical protein
VCGRITTWINERQGSIQSLDSALSGHSGLPQIKTQLVDYYTSGVASTNTMISGVQAAGAPTIPHGQNLAQGLIAGLQSIQATYVQAQTQAEQLPTDNPTVFGTQSKNIVSSEQNAGNQVQASLNQLSKRYSSSELNAALTNQAACQPLHK